MIWSRVPRTRVGSAVGQYSTSTASRARQFERGVMGFGRQRDDQVEIVVLEIVQRLRLTLVERQAVLGQHGIDEGVALAGADAGRRDEDGRRQQPAAPALRPSASARRSCRT